METTTTMGNQPTERRYDKLASITQMDSTSTTQCHNKQHLMRNTPQHTTLQQAYTTMSQAWRKDKRTLLAVLKQNKLLMRNKLVNTLLLICPGMSTLVFCKVKHGWSILPSGPYAQNWCNRAITKRCVDDWPLFDSHYSSSASNSKLQSDN